MKEPVWLRNDVLLAAHRRHLAEHGGLEGIRDAGVFLSAMDRPRNLFLYGGQDTDVCALAASYGYGLARNYPFADGNKRTALIAMRLFLRLNGADLVTSSENKYRTIMRLASGDMMEGDLAEWLRRRGRSSDM